MQQALGLQLTALQTGYSTRRATRRVVSRSLDAYIPPGSLTMLLGPNGSGKSTLMHTISGLLAPLSGRIKVGELELSALAMEERSRALSLVLTDRLSSDLMSVIDVVRIGRYPHIGYMAKLSQQDEQIVHEALRACNLLGMEGRTLSQLSDGERQRVMIARALAQDTPLILLDEPTAHLDLPSRIEIIVMLRELAHTHNKCILLSTHELDLALSWADNIWLMNREGEMYAGSRDEIAEGDYLDATFGNDRLRYDKERRTFILRQ